MASGMETDIFIPSVTTNAKNITHFDIVKDFSDHYFANTKQSFTGGDASQKAISKEWKILRNSLPDSIYVRIYEERCDLMRAAIVGPSGTPYHDGLFFFDILFPAEYPNMPPKVNYRCFGMGLNPNLYSNGYVCLSLLNTWHGKSPTEKWIPKKSTILQVLISIQALVLNEKPFYNEPHRPNIREEVLSNAYNENVFVLSCKSMILLLKNPPLGFEDLVTLHFYDRSQVILAACQAYVDGLQKVGFYNQGQPLFKNRVQVSSLFKASMTKPYEELIAAFDRIDPRSKRFSTKLSKIAEKIEDRHKVNEESKKTYLMRKLRQFLSTLKKLAWSFIIGFFLP